ncbi:hypothetical protein [Victivallis lenta]|nr:hypothetical protein [Victivallis lenta]
MEEEKKERCFPFRRCGRKAVLDALTIGFVTGAAAAIGLFKLLRKL